MNRFLKNLVFIIASGTLTPHNLCASENVTRSAFESTYTASHKGLTAFINANIFTGAGEELENATLIIKNGKITAIGTDIAIPVKAEVIDVYGKWLTPGIVDIHAHQGTVHVFQNSSLPDHNDTTAGPIRPDLWVEHSIWPGDPSFRRSLEAGTTALHILPGSHNIIGGRGVTLKPIIAATVEAMKFPGAPHSVKMACGENQKRAHSKRSGPVTRMGATAALRAALLDAEKFRNAPQEVKNLDGVRRLKTETLIGILNGEILPHIHCHRSDDIARMIEVSKEFDFQIAAIHHGSEAYKVAKQLSNAEICSAVWTDWWGFTYETWDDIDENAAFLHVSNACVVIHSDSLSAGQRLNQEMAKAWAHGKRQNLDISRADAMGWITLNAAKSIGIADKTGSLEPGKMADIVLWSGDPFSSFSITEQVYIDGVLRFDRYDPTTHQSSDIEAPLQKEIRND